MYQLTRNPNLVLRNDGVTIALPPNESEGFRYQEWVDAGGIPEPWVGTPDISIVPMSITPRQGWIVLSRAGLLEAVQAKLDAMPGQKGIEARIDFQKATEWKRDWPLLVEMANELGLTEEQVDQMFIDGSLLK